VIKCATETGTETETAPEDEHDKNMTNATYGLAFGVGI